MGFCARSVTGETCATGRHTLRLEEVTLYGGIHVAVLDLHQTQGSCLGRGREAMCKTNTQKVNTVQRSKLER